MSLSPVSSNSCTPQSCLSWLATDQLSTGKVASYALLFFGSWLAFGADFFAAFIGVMAVGIFYYLTSGSEEEPENHQATVQRQVTHSTSETQSQARRYQNYLPFPTNYPSYPSYLQQDIRHQPTQYIQPPPQQQAYFPAQPPAIQLPRQQSHQPQGHAQVDYPRVDDPNPFNQPQGLAQGIDRAQRTRVRSDQTFQSNPNRVTPPRNYIEQAHGQRQVAQARAAPDPSRQRQQQQNRGQACPNRSRNNGQRQVAQARAAPDPSRQGQQPQWNQLAANDQFRQPGQSNPYQPPNNSGPLRAQRDHRRIN